MDKLRERIEAVVDRKLRPQLLLHGGGMETVQVEKGRYVFRLTGRCAGCPSAYLTTEEVIRSTLLADVPELREVVLCQQVSEELLTQAKELLHHA